MKAYYNDNDPYVCAWIRNLIKAGEIPYGDVDDRPIQKIRPKDLKGYVQCHFFCGILGWALALKLAKWPKDREVWTGSCPCTPFSVAGKRKGFADDRHLWPAWWRLIRKCRPRVVFMEQVASKDGLAWLDVVSHNLEGADYAVGALDLCAASVGAAHIRQRLYVVADSAGNGAGNDESKQKRRASTITLPYGEACELAESDGGLAGDGKLQRGGQQRQQPEDRSAGEGMEHSSRNGRVERRAESGGRGAEPRRGARGMADARSERRQQNPGSPLSDETTNGRTRRDGREPNSDHVASGHGATGGLADPENADGRAGKRGTQKGTRAEELGRGRPSSGGAADGFWSDAGWLLCRDGKYRPVPLAEPEVLGVADGLPPGVGRACPERFPLTERTPQRIGRLRGYGNSLCVPLAAEFVKAYMKLKRP